MQTFGKLPKFCQVKSSRTAFMGEQPNPWESCGVVKQSGNIGSCNAQQPGSDVDMQ